MPNPKEIDREFDRFMAALPDGGAGLLLVSRMVGVMVKALREKKGSDPIAPHLRAAGFTDEEIDEHIMAAFAFVHELPAEIWRHDA